MLSIWWDYKDVAYFSYFQTTDQTTINSDVRSLQNFLNGKNFSNNDDLKSHLTEFYAVEDQKFYREVARKFNCKETRTSIIQTPSTFQLPHPTYVPQTRMGNFIHLTVQIFMLHNERMNPLLDYPLNIAVPT